MRHRHVGIDRVRLINSDGHAIGLDVGQPAYAQPSCPQEQSMDALRSQLTVWVRSSCRPVRS